MNGRDGAAAGAGGENQRAPGEAKTCTIIGSGGGEEGGEGCGGDVIGI